MKIVTGKTARAIRRREISSKLMAIIDNLVEQNPNGDKRQDIARIEARELILELHELCAAETNISRRRK